MNQITFLRPVPQHRTWIVLCDGKIIGKVRWIGPRGCLASVSGMDLGGSHGNPGIKCFPNLPTAKLAIMAAVA